MRDFVPRIKIQNFGPIRDSGWIDIKKVTLFLGNQGSGKSTIAKLISAFFWIEKISNRSGFNAVSYLEKDIGKFRKNILAYHRIENYLSDATSIRFEGISCSIDFDMQRGMHVESKNPPIYDWHAPKITYVPAERNFISYLKLSDAIRLSSDSLRDFADDFNNSLAAANDYIELPINKASFKYDELSGEVKIKGTKYAPIPLSEAASGFQSIVPLYSVSRSFSKLTNSDSSKEYKMTAEELTRFQQEAGKIYDSQGMTFEQQRFAVSELSKKIKKTAFINIVEEPEQNLFPTSQASLLHALLGFNAHKPNKLIITTHSPYIVDVLSLAIKVAKVKTEIAGRPDLEERLGKIVPLDSAVPVDDGAIYELDENSGAAARLSMEYGVPSDKNFLNKLLGDLDADFDRLLDIQDAAQ